MRTVEDYDPDLYDRLEALSLDRLIANDPVPADPEFWRGVLSGTPALPAKEEELIEL